MSAEVPNSVDPYGFTEREHLHDRMSHERFSELIADGQTVIYEIELSINNYGEFLFIRTSRSAGEKSAHITFWGLGYHEYRERWLTDVWSWYEALPSISKQRISNEEALEIIHKRQEDIADYAAIEYQSQRGKLFELLADLTDEDGALAELEDFANWFDNDLE